MKRMFAVLAILILILSLSACGASDADETTATASPAAADSPTPTSAVSASPTPSETPQAGETRYAPSDLPGEELNPLYEIAFPEDFSLEKVAVKAHDDGTAEYGFVYRMIFSAPSAQSAVAGLMNTSGIGSETTEDEANQTLQSVGMLTLNGVLQDGSSFACDFQTEEDGSCTVEAYIEAPLAYLSRYAQFIEDNYCENMFGAIRLGLATIPSENVFPVNITISYEEGGAKTEFATYYFADDVETILKILVNGGGYDTYDPDSQYFVMDYGKASGDVWVGGNGAVSVRQWFNGVPDTPLSDYAYVPSVTLETYGFSFDKEQGICQYEAEDGMGCSLMFHSSEWGDADVDWQIEFSFPLMGATLYLWYRPDSGRYDVCIEMDDGTVVEYAYDVEGACYSDVTPDADTASACLSGLFVNAENGDVFAQPFVLLERQSVSLAGVGFAQLAALSPTDLYDCAPLADLPALPAAGSAEQTAEVEQTSEEEQASEEEQLPEVEPEIVGNTCANLFMAEDNYGGGFFAVQGEWSYFGNPGLKCLYRAKTLDGSDLQALCEGNATFLNPVGDTIYYCDMSDDSSICSVGTDGQNQQKLADGHCEDLSYADGWLYYCAPGGICKLTVDGGEPTELLSGQFCDVYAYGSWVYYIDGPDAGGISRVRVEGGEPQSLMTEYTAFFYAIQDDQIYCLIDAGESTDVLRMNLDGTDAETVYSSDGKIETINVSGNRLFIATPAQGVTRASIVVWNMETNAVERTIDDLAAPVVSCFGSDIYYFTDASIIRLDLDSGEQIMMFN